MVRARFEHLGSAHDDGEVEALKAAARQRLAEGQGALDLGLNAVGVDGEPLEIVASKSSHLWDGLCRAYQVLGFNTATGGDEVFRDLLLARIIEPTSKQDSLRVLAETGIAPAEYRTVTRWRGYFIPGTSILRNRVGAQTSDALRDAENDLVEARAIELREAPEPLDDRTYDLAYLRAIHRQLFQDVHVWAGDVRTVGIEC